MKWGSSLLALALLLAACAGRPPTSAPMPDGDWTMAPAGWTELCARAPETPRC